MAVRERVGDGELTDEYQAAISASSRYRFRIVLEGRALSWRRHFIRCPLVSASISATSDLARYGSDDVDRLTS